MKTLNSPPHMQQRRHFLGALLMSPMLMYALSTVHDSRFPAIAPSDSDSDSFIIVNGWVMLKKDLTEHMS
jgi:hypothetical protein